MDYSTEEILDEEIQEIEEEQPEILNVFLDIESVLVGEVSFYGEHRVVIKNPFKINNGSLEKFHIYSDNDYIVINAASILSLSPSSESLKEKYLELKNA